VSGTAIGEHSGPLLLSVPAFDVGTTGDNASIAIPFPQYLLSRVWLYGASANLSTSTSALSIRTASGGGGTAIVSSQILTGLTAAGVTVSLPVAVSALQTATLLFLRIIQGLTPVAGTVKALLELIPAN